MKRVAKPFNGEDAILSINAFIPGQVPEEIKITIRNFRGCSFGAHRTMKGFKEDLIKVLKDLYGNNVK